MSVRREELEVRQRGGALSSKNATVYVVLTKEAILYYEKKENYRSKAPALETVKLSDIVEVQSVKSKGGGFVFEVKTAVIRTQHTCHTDEDRQQWVYVIMKAKADSNSVQEVPDSDDEGGKSDSTVILPSNKTSTASMNLATTKEFEQHWRKEREEFYSAMTKAERKEWLDTKLEKHYKKELDKTLKKWKEEKSAILDELRLKEIESIENSYQQKQLDLEKALQEKRSKVEV